MKNTTNILATAAILILTGCSSYRGVYDSTSYMNTCDAKTNLKLQDGMTANISNKHKSLYETPHVNLSDYTDPNIAQKKQQLPKYRLYMNTDLNSSYDKIANIVSQLNYTVLKADKDAKYIAVKTTKGAKYKLQLTKFNSGSILYVMNKEDKIVLQSKLQELFNKL